MTPLMSRETKIYARRKHQNYDVIGLGTAKNDVPQTCKQASLSRSAHFPPDIDTAICANLHVRDSGAKYHDTILIGRRELVESSVLDENPRAPACHSDPERAPPWFCKTCSFFQCLMDLCQHGFSAGICHI
eukprot:gb/GECG01012193.1/.p1 GENE.gb/GECG01012193.1/~~gb/GECG01012193.1/.p1  ORF type:complete len:131 (+),score=5.64 gb/GECG01012193.1/:1-393(+)